MESDRELWRKRHNDRSEQNDGISRIHCIVLDRGQDLTSYNPGDDLVAGGFQFFADWSIQSQGWRGEMLCRAENNAGRK